MMPSPFAARIRAANDRLRELRDRLRKLVAEMQREAFERRLAELGEGALQPLGVVWFPWHDQLTDPSPEDPLGRGREGARQRTDQEIQESGGGDGMIDFEGLPPDSGGGGGGGF